MVGVNDQALVEMSCDRWLTADELATALRVSVRDAVTALKDLHSLGYVDRLVGDPLADLEHDVPLCRWRKRVVRACCESTRHHRFVVVCSLEEGHDGPHFGGRHVWHSSNLRVPQEAVR
jgi:hypothetical protein